MYDPELYREKQEVEEWKKRDPITNLIERLKQQNLWQDDDWTRMEEEVSAEIAKSIEFADAGQWEPIEDLTRFVYSDAASTFIPPRVLRQAQDERTGEEKGGGL